MSSPSRCPRILVPALLAVSLIHVPPVHVPPATAQPNPPTTQPRQVSLSNPLGFPEGMVDRLAIYDTATQFQSGQLDRTRLITEPRARIVLDDTRGRYPRTGRWTSHEYSADFPFTELLPSWNLDTPPDTGARIDVRVRAAGSNDWSPWLYVGSWGRILGTGQRTVIFDWGAVHVDVIVLDRPADAYQVRVVLQSFDLDPDINPALRRLAVSYSGVIDDPDQRQELSDTPPINGEWARDLAVPFFAQQDAPRPLRSQICSPTSVAMLLAHWQHEQHDPVENALAIYDADYGMFGNWNRAVQRCAELGLEGHLTRFRNWEQVKSTIADGQPIIAAIRFRQGEFPTNVLSSTNGHLIVIRGMTDDGDIIVNDPASRDRGNGAIYNPDELANAWFHKGGVAYIIHPPK